MDLTQISASLVPVASGLVLFLFALPSYIAAIKQAGLIRALLIIVGLSGIILGFELFATKTTLPYGAFSYSTAFGQQIMNTVPWLVVLVYPPVVLGAFWLANKFKPKFFVILMTALISTCVYLLTAPAMAKLTLWQWQYPGPYFGVPLRAFAGWFVLALISSIFVSIFWGSNDTKRKLGISLLAISLFWTGVNLGIASWVPAGIGFVFSIFLLVLMRAEKRLEA